MNSDFDLTTIDNMLSIYTWLASCKTDTKSLACLKLDGVKKAYDVPVDCDLPVLPIRWI